jgi:hypothetical protein
MTVVTSLYASGYKFNLSWPIKFNLLLQKTGMLAVATKPANATIYLNDEPQNNLSLNPWKTDYITTPAKIKNVLPGEYELRFEEAGYWPYKQKINIYSGQTTFIENVNLFREDQPLLVLATPETDLKISPDNKYIYAGTAKKIITLKNETIRDLNITNTNSGTWLTNDKLFNSGNIFDPIKADGDINYAAAIGTEATNWQFEESTGFLYYQNKNSINRFDTNSQTSISLISGANYLAFEPRQDRLFTIVNANNETKLFDYNLNISQNESEWTLPNSGHYSFVQDIPNQLAVYDDQNQTLYLFNEISIGSGPIIIRNIKNWTMLDDQSLIYTNDFEIYIFHLANGQSDLVTRRSEEINKIIWNSAGNYLIFTSPNSINVLDFKSQNSTLLFQADKIDSPALDVNNKNLYFWAKVGNETGIYKIIMQ